MDTTHEWGGPMFAGRHLCKKHYPHSLGLSAAFRQHRAESHCRFIHGYALAFTYTFWTHNLDARNWVIDFGSLKPIKEWLVETFDHKLLVAEDDPLVAQLVALHESGGANVALVKRVGCESFAEMAARFCIQYLRDQARGDVYLRSVECAEHEGNSASFEIPEAAYSPHRA